MAEDLRLREDLSVRKSEEQDSELSPARTFLEYKFPLIAIFREAVVQDLSQAAASLAVSKEHFSSAIGGRPATRKRSLAQCEEKLGAGVEPGQTIPRGMLWCRI
jgi:hypothetical protein